MFAKWFGNKQENIQAFVDQIDHPLFRKNKTGQFDLVNQAFCTFLGKERAQIINTTDDDHFSRKRAKRFKKVDRRLEQKWKDKKELVIYNLREEIETPKGERIIHTRKRCWINADGEFGGIIGVFYDYTDDQSTRDLFDLVQAKVSDVIYAHDADGNLIWFNAAGAKLLNVKDFPLTKAFRKVNIRDYLDDKDIGVFNELVAGTTKATSQRFRLHVKGTQKVIAVTTVRVTLPTEAQSIIVGIGRDETARIKNEADLREVQKKLSEENEKLKQSQLRLAEREQRLTTSIIAERLSHQFKGPLLEGSFLIDQAIRELTRDSNSNVANTLDRLKNLHGKLISCDQEINTVIHTLAARDVVSQPTVLHQCAGQARVMMTRRECASPRRSYTFDDLQIEPVLPDIVCSPFLTEQSIFNLLSNASRHCKARVRVGSRLCLDSSAVVFWVNDDGDGFDDAAMKVLSSEEVLGSSNVYFENAAETGVGLFICFDLLRKRQGIPLKFHRKGGDLGGALIEVFFSCVATSARKKWSDCFESALGKALLSAGRLNTDLLENEVIFPVELADAMSLMGEAVFVGNWAETAIAYLILLSYDQTIRMEHLFCRKYGQWFEFGIKRPLVESIRFPLGAEMNLDCAVERINQCLERSGTKARCNHCSDGVFTTIVVDIPLVGSEL